MIALRVTIGGTVAGLLATSMVLASPAPVGAAAAAGDAPPSEASVSPEVLDQIDQTGEAFVLVEIATEAPVAREGQEVREDLESEGGQLLPTPQPLVATTVDREEVEELRGSPGVQRVLPDRAYRLEAAPNLEAIGAPAAWPHTTGAGQTIAIIDNGVDGTHPALAGKLVDGACFSDTGDKPNVFPLCPGGAHFAEGAAAGGPCAVLGMGTCTHGTHVAGIASATAPAASLLSVQVFSLVTSLSLCDPQPSCLLTFDSDLIAALSWVEEKAAVHPLAAVNLSIGGETSPGACNANPLKAPIDALHGQGVATVAASGNGGYANQISWPACIPSALAVGSVNSALQVVSTPCQVTQNCFSNSSPMLDFLAPGTGVVSSIPGGGTWPLSGTSMATPHVSGAVALLREAKGPISVDHASTILRMTGLPVTDSRNGRVTPLPQLGTAVADLAPIGHLDEVITSSGGSTAVLGWALDPDTPSSTVTQVRVDGELAYEGTAGAPRPDIATAYPGLGEHHGVANQVELPDGVSNVCLLALDATWPERPPVEIGCKMALVNDGVIVAPASLFLDVGPGHPFLLEIGWMTAEGITEGFPGNVFLPSATLSRQATAAFLYRLAGSPEGTDPECVDAPFDDVATHDAFCGEISWLKAAGIASGNADGSFAPSSGLSRQAMAAFLYRYAGSPEGLAPECATQPFDDVALGNVFCGEILWLKGTGIANGFGDGRFHPSDLITRQAMAAFLYRYANEVLGS